MVLTGITCAAWLLVIVDSYLFFNVIIPFSPPLHVIGAFTLLALAKVGLTFGLGVLWFVVIISMTQLYARSKVQHQPPMPAS